MKKKLIVIFFALVTFCFDLSAQVYTLQPAGEEGKDCAIRSSTEELSPEDSPSMSVYTWTAGCLVRKRALVAFDLSEFSPNMNLVSAKLSLYFNPTDPSEGIDEHSGDNGFFVERIVDEWQEDATSWYIQPSTTWQNRAEVSASTDPTQDFIDIDVTALVNDMLADPDNSHGFMVKMQNEDIPYRMVILATSDHVNPALHPKLELDFTALTTSTDHLDETTFDLSISPNPVDKNGRFILESSINPTEEVKFTLFDITGKAVLNGEVHHQKQEIAVNHLNPAVYLLKVYDQKGNSMTKKLVVK